MFFKSIRFKIVLWYMLVLACTLLIFSWLLYQNLEAGLRQNLDDLLLSRSDGVVSSIATYWAAEKLNAAEKIEGATTPVVFSTINNLNFAKIAQHFIEERYTDPARLNFVVSIYSANGQHIVSTKNAPEVISLSAETSRNILRGQRFFQNFSKESSKERTLDFRGLITPVMEQSRVAYIVLVAAPMEPLRIPMTRLKTILSILLPLVVLFTGILGSFLARVALRPVDKMITAIRQIEVKSLKMRIETPATNDEIRRLADTFNEMLGQLERTFLSQQRFIQDASHELKTPLTILRGEMEIALKKIRSAAEYEEVLKSSLEEITRMQRIVEDLLFLARFGDQKVALDFKPVDFGKIGEEVIHNIRILAEGKRIQLHSQSGSGLWVMGRADQLKRLMLNLLDNAIKYTPEGGEIRVSLESEGRNLKFIVKDTGTGIPPQDLPHIFDRFFRSDLARSSSGVGLGLSIVKSIVEFHQGTIRVESKLGQGSEFSVLIPQINPA